MRSDFVRALVCVGGIIGAAALGAAKSADPVGTSGHEFNNHLQKELVRLGAHFDSVDTELRARDVSTLTTAQLSSRMRLISWLREYRDAGTFPINDRFPGRHVPFFRDSKGILCAMAYLIDRSGRGDIVERIAHTRNNAFIRELADDPALIAWLDSVGLDVTEAARIQPGYDGISPEGAENRLSSDFALATLALGGGSIGATAVNVVSPSLVSEIAGLLLGGAAVINGVAHLDQNRGTKRVGYASIIAGSVSLASSAGAFIRSRMRADPSAPSQSRLTIAPAILPTPSSYRLGLAGTASF